VNLSKENLEPVRNAISNNKYLWKKKQEKC